MKAKLELDFKFEMKSETVIRTITIGRLECSDEFYEDFKNMFNGKTCESVRLIPTI